MENNITYRNTERVNELLDHRKAMRVALQDMRLENISIGILGLLPYSVKRQLLAFNTINIFELDYIIDTQKKVPLPPVIFGKVAKKTKIYKKARTSIYGNNPIIHYNEYVNCY